MCIGSTCLLQYIQSIFRDLLVFLDSGREKESGSMEDVTCERIKWLINNYLRKVADSPQWGAWETLYQDPADGRYWERTYPQSELHGGGPPQLRCLALNEAKQKYGLR